MAQSQPDHFDHFLARHGEIAVLALVENAERFLGVRAPVTASLEQRWARLEAPPARPLFRHASTKISSPSERRVAA